MPEDAPGDGESDADEDPNVIDFLRDLSNIGYDDAVLGVLGSGRDVEYAEPGRDQAVADLLSAWRNDVDSEPLGPIDEQAIEAHEAHEAHEAEKITGTQPLPASATPPGGPVSDSIYDKAAQLYQLASEAPTTSIHTTMVAVEAWGQQVQGLLGQTTGGVMLQGLVERALQTLQELQAGIQNAKNTAEDEARKHMG